MEGEEGGGGGAGSNHDLFVSEVGKWHKRVYCFFIVLLIQNIILNFYTGMEVISHTLL